MSFGALLLTVAGLVALVPSSAWQVYSNPRYGATARVPAGWRAGPPPANGDGAAFTSPDGHAKVSVYGEYDDGDLDMRRIAMSPESGGRATYQFHKGNVYVTSGVRGDHVFYHRGELVCRGRVLISLWFDYPAAEAVRYDALAIKMAATLHERPGACADV